MSMRPNAGEVYVATPDQKIIDVINKFGGKVIKTSDKHQTGTDRIYEVFKETLKGDPNIIVNLQGDMPNIDPENIKDLIDYMYQDKCEIGTLASKFISDTELVDQNVVKVLVKEKMKPKMFYEALDFVRSYLILTIKSTIM